MPATESIRSRRRNGDNAEIVVIVWDVVDDSQAIATAVTLAPPQYLGLNRQRPNAQKISDAYSMWEVVFPYTPRQLQSEEPGGGGGGGEEDPPEGIIEFDGSGTTAHITQSLATVSKVSFVDGTDPPDHQRAIGVAKDGGGVHVEGTDVLVPGSVLTLTRHRDEFEIDGEYRRNLRRLRGKVNKFAYTVDGVLHPPGELLFLYARGSQRDHDDWEITCAFEEDEEREIEVVPGKPKVRVPPHHYLWVQYRQDTDAAGKQLLMVPEFAFVEKIYDEADFLQIIDGAPPLP